MIVLPDWLACSGSVASQDLTILNRQFKGHYREFLTYLAVAVPGGDQLSHFQRLQLSYFLLLQDRVDAAVSTFNSIGACPAEAKLQYDYMDAYLKFFSGEDLDHAGKVAAGYTDYPVLKKRKLFQDILDQLKEIQGCGLCLCVLCCCALLLLAELMKLWCCVRTPADLRRKKRS